MEIHGILTGISKDVIFINVDLSEKQEKYLTSMAEKDVDVKLTTRKRRRSLDANAYYWVLVSKLAEALETSKPFMHNLLLRKYGQLDTFDGQIATFILPDTEAAAQKAYELETVHLKPSDEVNEESGTMYRTWYLMKGSHEYNTREMSVLINGTVEDARSLGIETMPTDELERLISMWNPKGGDAK